MILTPFARALGQLDDPVLLGVLWRSLLLSAVCFVGLHVAAVWAVHRLHG